MSLTGQTEPALSAMAEIPSNVPVQLKPDTTLTFLHYTRCKLVTVVGGTLTLTRADYKEDGRVESETDGPCPRIYALSDSGEGRSTGGIIARGLSTAPHWPANPVILFTGVRANAVATAAIVADGQPGQPPIPLAVTGSRAQQPQGAPALRPDGHYTLRLTMRDRRDPVDVPFIAMAPSGADALVVLRAD